MEGSSDSLAPPGAEAMAELLARPASSGSAMSGLGRSQSEATVDGGTNGYAAPGSPSKLSEELARRLAVADSNPPLPQARCPRWPGCPPPACGALDARAAHAWRATAGAQPAVGLCMRARRRRVVPMPR